MVRMKRSALPLVRGLPGLMRWWRSPSWSQAAAVRVRDVGGAVVGHDRLDAHAALGEPVQRAAQEGDRAGCREVVEHFGVGQPRVVVDRDVHELVAGQLSLAPIDAAVDLALAVTDDPMSGAARADLAELLDVDVDELARTAALVAVRGLRRLETRALAKPDPLQPQRHRRERPTLHQHAPSDQRPALRTGTSVSVQLHPVSPLDWWLQTPPASKEARMKQRGQE